MLDLAFLGERSSNEYIDADTGSANVVIEDLGLDVAVCLDRDDAVGSVSLMVISLSAVGDTAFAEEIGNRLSKR